MLTGPNEMHLADFKTELNSAFEMLDLGLLHHYLGIQFKQCDGGYALCQTKYIEFLLRRFDLEDYKPIVTPMEIGLKLSLHDARDYFDVTLYQHSSRLLVVLFIYALQGQIFGLQSLR